MNTRLKIAIVESGKAQIVIAKEIGLHESLLSRIVNGHLTPNDDQKAAIATAVGKPVAELFSEAA